MRMIFPEKTLLLKDGREAILRAPHPERDAAAMAGYLKTCAQETNFLMREPEECDIPIERERAFLQEKVDSGTSAMIVCEVEGELAGLCSLDRKTLLRTRHRATVGVALMSRYWGLGIGTAMLQELIEQAQKAGVSRLELEYIEGNERARGLYEKLGFRVTGERPDAIRLKDGTSLKEISMARRLD